MDPLPFPPMPPPPSRRSSGVNVFAVMFGVLGLFAFVAGGFLYWRATAKPRAVASAAPESPAPTGTPAGPGGTVKLELYVMSQCPYGTQVEGTLKDVVEKLGPHLDFHVDFIGQSSGGTLSTMHGVHELKGDLVQVCAMRYTPLWYLLVLCQNKNTREVDTNWEACANELGIGVSAIRDCAEGEEGKRLLTDSFDRASKRGARGSPTIYIGGAQYTGGRKIVDFMKAICNAYAGARPAACASIPESPKVNVTLLADKRCAECDPHRVELAVTREVANPVWTRLDYGDPAGKKLYDAIAPVKLPVAVFDATLEADKDASSHLAWQLKPSGSYKLLSTGSDWNPTCADDGGCAREECRVAMFCRPEEPRKLEVFVMSQCPFCAKGMTALKDVLDDFHKAGTNVDFDMNFIGRGTAATGLSSMHGQGEVDEDIRQVCAKRHFARGLKYLDYVVCRDKNFRDTNWEPCAASSGISAAVIKTCVDTDGKALLEKSFQYSDALGMNASPTWLANGKFKFNGIDAAAIKGGFCAHNKAAGCESNPFGLKGPPTIGGGPGAPGERLGF